MNGEEIEQGIPCGESGPLTNEQQERESKIQREERLRWQSRLMLWIVLPVAAAGLIVFVEGFRTRATVEGLAVCAVFGLLVWMLHAATPFAAITGFLLTSCMYLGTVTQPAGSWRHTALLCGLALFVLAFASTRFRRASKEMLGTAESRRGRSASQVTANLGAAAILALSPTCRHLPQATTAALMTAVVAALCEAAADTVSSEIGQAVGGTPRLLTTGRQVAPGTDGAISVAGTAAGCCAGAILAAIAVPTLGLDLRSAAVAGAAGVFGLFFDSLIGATVERGGRLNNDAVNFLSTIAAALAAFIFTLGIHIS